MEQKTKALTFRISPEELSSIKAVATEKSLQTGSYCRFILMNHIKKNFKLKKEESS